ncbi:MAG: esterase family protein [Acidobacteria bacterium]|nr:esterase family protein [Acidobacteriota bacterium]
MTRRSLSLVFLPLLQMLGQNAMSPEVQADRKVTFRVKAPNAQKVEVALEGQPRLAMAKGEGGVWTATTGVLAPDIYGYTFNIDGTGFVDPANGQLKTNALAVSSAVLVPGDKPMPWEHTAVPHGVVHHHFFESAIAGDKRDYYVYTPPGYNPKKTYPLMVLLHGFSDYADGWTTVGKANLIMDNLLAEGKVKPMIVLMTLGYGVPIDKLRTGIPRDQNLWQNNAAKYGETLFQEVLPSAEKLYKLPKKSTQRAIVGLSMGGGESLQIGLNRLDYFAWVGAMSAGGGTAKYEETFPKLGEADNSRLKLLWLACGKDDRLMENNRKFVGWLKSKNVKHTWVESEGAHTWLVWRRYLAEFAQQLRF